MKRKDKNMERNDEEEIKREIIEDYLNYKEISEAITKGDTTINFYFAEEQNGNECWEIQTLNGTKEDGIILLKSTLGDFYVNRNRRKGKIQYLNKEECEAELTKRIEKLTKEIREMKRKMNNDIKHLNNQMEKMLILLEVQDQKHNKRQIRSERYNEKTCYGCGKTGHIRPLCPENMKDGRRNYNRNESIED